MYYGNGILEPDHRYRSFYAIVNSAICSLYLLHLCLRRVYAYEAND